MQATEEEQHVVANAAPVGEHNHHPLGRPLAAAQPRHFGQADHRTKLVDPTHLVIKELGEDNRHDHRGGDIGQEVERAKNATAPQVFDVEKDSQHNGNKEAGGQQNVGELQGVKQRLPDVGIFEDDLIIFQPHPFHRPKAAPTAKAELKSPCQRIKAKDRKADKKGRDKEIIQPVPGDLFPQRACLFGRQAGRARTR